MAPPKSRPWETENKKLTQAATFLRLRIVAGLLNANNAVKAQQIICLAAHFRLFKGQARIRNRKKVAEGAELLFLQQADRCDGSKVPRKARELP